MVVGRRGRGSRNPWILKLSVKKVVFVVSSGKKINFTTFGPPLEKIWKNPLVVPPGKNPSDTHAPFVYICQHL